MLDKINFAVFVTEEYDSTLAVVSQGEVRPLAIYDQ
jgi:hypothetical protein